MFAASVAVPVRATPCCGDVESVVIVGPVDHPRADERISTREVFEHESTGFSERRKLGWYFECLPVMAVQKPSEGVLQFVVAEDLWFADDQSRFGRQGGSRPTDRSMTSTRSSICKKLADFYARSRSVNEARCHLVDPTNRQLWGVARSRRRPRWRGKRPRGLQVRCGKMMKLRVKQCSARQLARRPPR